MPRLAGIPIRAAAWAVALLLFAVTSTARSAAGGTEFFEGSFVGAVEAAHAQDRALLVVGGADWCAPCHTMRDRIWPRADVGAWVSEHVVPYALDVDAERRRATQLGVGPVPVMLLLRDGRELGRHVGLLDAPELLAWLERTVAAPVADDAPRYDLGELPEPPGRGVRARHTAAKELLESGRLDEAFDAFLWLWEEGHLAEPSFRGVRRSFMAGQLAQLVERHPPARAAFHTILDRTEERLHGSAPEEIDWEDFGVLTITVLDDPERLLELYASMVAEDGSAGELPESMQRRVFELLYEQGNLAAAARATPDLFERAAARLDEMNADIQRMSSMRVADMGSFHRRRAAESVARLHVAAIAADREGVARAIGDRMREYLDDELGLTALLEEALATGTARAMHHEWLADTGEWWVALDDLRERLAEAYTPPPGLAMLAPAPPALDPSVGEVVQAIEDMFDTDGGVVAVLRNSRRFSNWGDDAVPALRIVLDDEFADDNSYAVFEALRQCGTEACFDLMLEVMAGRTRMEQDSFDFVLGRLVADADARAVLQARPVFRDLMERLANSRHSFDQERFAEVAAAMGWDDAIPRLEAMLADPDADLREAAAAALEELTGTPVVVERPERAMPAERLLPDLLGAPIQTSVRREEPARFTSSEPIAFVQPTGASFWRGARDEPVFAVHLGAGYRALGADGTLRELRRLPLFPMHLRGVGTPSGREPTTLLIAGNIPRIITNTVCGLDAEGRALWTWRNGTERVADAVPFYLDDGAAGVIVSSDSKLFALDLQGELLWRHDEFTPAYELATHPRFPGLLVTLFGDLDVFEVERSRVVTAAEGVETSGYATKMELFPGADGEPALVITGRGDGVSRISRSDLSGAVAWEGDVPGSVRSLAQLDVGAPTPLFVVATDALELLVFDADGTLLHASELPDPHVGDNPGPIDLTAGRLPDGRAAVHVQMVNFGYLYPLDPSVLDAR